MNYAATGQDEMQQPDIDSDKMDGSEEQSSHEMIAEFTQSNNICDLLDEDTINKIGMKCSQGFDIDMQSIAARHLQFEELEKIAKAPDKKMYPWPGASNIRYPIVIDAAMQFNARSYPILMNNGRVAKMKIVGADHDGSKTARSERVSQHMSWQLMDEMDGWDEGMDALLLTLPIVGCMFKKVWRDRNSNTNMSELVPATQLIVHSKTKSFKSCPRISHIISLYPYEIQENVNLGLWSDNDLVFDIDQVQDPEDFIEQHTLYDLDDDGYPEPYIITIHKDSGRVMRIVANYTTDDVLMGGENGADGIVKITSKQYFVKYQCFPDPEGSFYGIGLGSILHPLNESVSTIINQLIDAGHLANAGGGFIGKGFRISSGNFVRKPAEWTKVDVSGIDIKSNVYPLPVPEPSQALFALLGLLIDAGKSIASVQDVLTGGGGQNMPASSVLALIEQGMKVYTAVFKRIYRSLKSELRLLYELNGEHLTNKEYQNVIDDQEATVQDYEGNSKDITPEADPSMATDVQKMAKSEYMRSFMGAPGVNDQEIIKYSMQSANIEHPERFLIDQSKKEPDPAQLAQLAEIELKEREQSRKERETLIKNLKATSEMLKNVAETDEKGANNSINMAEITLLYEEAKQILEGLDGEQNNDGSEQIDGNGVSGLEGNF